MIQLEGWEAEGVILTKAVSIASLSASSKFWPDCHVLVGALNTLTISMPEFAHFISMTASAEAIQARDGHGAKPVGCRIGSGRLVVTSHAK
jgi:hypothetical protein